MRRIVIGAALTGAGVLIARTLRPMLRERCLAGCERVFDHMPGDFPPKRVMRGIEEIRVNTARTLELLEEREQAAGEPGPLSAAMPARGVGHAA